MDILLTGSTGNVKISKIYSNNGDNSFTEQTSIALTGIWEGDAAWGDYDNDGDLDIILTGFTENGKIALIYQNNGNNSFTEQTSTLLSKGISGSSVAWGDYDNDGDLDLLLTGSTDNGYIAKIFNNNIVKSNLKPSAPTNLESIVNKNSVMFSWNKSTDNETPQNGLHYNLVIGTTPNGINTLSPMSNRVTGYRRVVRLGNSETNNYTMKDLTEGVYYWSVQAIDGVFAGSEFASETNFIIGRSISLDSTSLNFGNVTANNSIQRKLKVENKATAFSDLNVTDIVMSNSVFTATPRSFTLKPGDSQEVTITFTPTEASSYSDTLSIFHNGSESPSKIELKGTGENEPVSIIWLSAKTIEYGEITVNSSLKKEINNKE